MSKAAEELKAAAVKYVKDKPKAVKKEVSAKPKAVPKPVALKGPKPAKVLVKKQVPSPMEKLIQMAKRGATELPPLQPPPEAEKRETIDEQQHIPFGRMLTQKPPQAPEQNHIATPLHQPASTLLSSTPGTKVKKEDRKPKTNSLMGMRPIGIGGYTLKKLD